MNHGCVVEDVGVDRRFTGVPSTPSWASLGAEGHTDHARLVS